MTREKKTAQKLIDFPPTLLARLNQHAASKRFGSANEIARRAIEAECERLDVVVAHEKARFEKLEDIARSRGVEVDAVIDEMHRAAKEPSLPGMADLASASLPATGTEG